MYKYCDELYDNIFSPSIVRMQTGGALVGSVLTYLCLRQYVFQEIIVYKGSQESPNLE